MDLHSGLPLRDNQMLFYSYTRNDRYVRAVEFECHLCIFLNRQDAKGAKGKTQKVFLRALRALAVKPGFSPKL